jgi:hypothetical protein
MSNNESFNKVKQDTAKIENIEKQLEELQDEFKKQKQFHINKIWFLITVGISCIIFFITYNSILFYSSIVDSPLFFRDKFQFTILLSISASVIPGIVYTLYISIIIDRHNSILGSLSREMSFARNKMILLIENEMLEKIEIDNSENEKDDTENLKKQKDKMNNLLDKLEKVEYDILENRLSNLEKIIKDIQDKKIC